MAKSRRYTLAQFCESAKARAMWDGNLREYYRFDGLPAYHLIPLIQRMEALERAAGQVLAAYEYDDNYALEVAYDAIKEALKVGVTDVG